MLPFEPVLEPGTPIRVTGEGGHPPRTFPDRTPGSLPRPAWEVLATLQDKTMDLAAVRRELEEADPRFAGLSGLEAGGEGARCAGAGKLPPAAQEALTPARPEGSFLLLPTEVPFGSEALSAFSAPLEPVIPGPHLMLGRGDAGGLGIADGDTILLTTDLGHFELPARVSDRTAEGIVLIPRLRGGALEAFVPGGGPLFGRIEKKEGSP
jgi:NADH-quinone oxidoreductase subunit G